MEIVQKIISFDLCGKVAHFRKFYSSSSALSYSIPPKTTVLGIISSIIEQPRDSYYNLYNDWLIGVEVINPFRKIFQKMNFLKVEQNINFNIDFEQSLLSKSSDVTGYGERTQTSFELLMPENIREGELHFRIYIGVKNPDDVKFETLLNALHKKESVYGISLGSANMLGYITNFIEEYSFQSLSEIEAIIQTCTIDDNVTLKQGVEFVVEQDIFPMKMKLKDADKDKAPTRIAEDVKSLVYPLTQHGMSVTIISNSHFYKLNNTVNIALV